MPNFTRRHNSSAIVAFYSRDSGNGDLLPDKVQHDFSPVGTDAVFKKVDSLPCAQDKSAMEYWDRELYLGERCLEVSGHIVEPLVVVCVRSIFWCQSAEVGLQIVANRGIRVLLDQERS